MNYRILSIALAAVILMTVVSVNAAQSRPTYEISIKNERFGGILNDETTPVIYTSINGKPTTHSCDNSVEVYNSCDMIIVLQNEEIIRQLKINNCILGEKLDKKTCEGRT